ncbi:MAG TPA: tetratricopeptide repeat protein, partial [Gemmataceae bacterium]|nr:tetratricopeptide repeat protein [Gemmataceae bacterium]
EPPEKKAQARASKIPPELSAIAMKALARNKADRYPTVELLRKDIELHLEGRSVSAKQDTIREMAVKLVKRNLGVSIATSVAAALLLIVGVWSLIAVLSANARALAEEAEKRDQAKRSVPALVRAARLTINEREFDDALSQLDMVLNINDNEADARLLKGQVLLARQEFQAARGELKAYLATHPDSNDVKNLIELANQAKMDDIASLTTLATELNRQKAYAVAAQLTQRAEKLMAPRKELLEVYRKRIEAAWPGLGNLLILAENGDLTLNLTNNVQVNDLVPLAGLPIDSLMITNNSKIRDLSPLRGMRLRMLDISGCDKIVDLEPLRGMPLTFLAMPGTAVDSLEPLRGMPLEKLVFGNTKVADLGPLRGMPLKKLWFDGIKAKSLEPLRGLKLTHLDCSNSQIADLAPLQGMPLTYLRLYITPVSDLSPLRGMRLTHLNIYRCPLTDLGPLKGMPLEELILSDERVPADFSVLQGMPLVKLEGVGDASITDISWMKGMPLRDLKLGGCTNLSDISAMEGMPLEELRLSATKVSDLKPLENAPLRLLEMTHSSRLSDLSPLRKMPLQTLVLRECHEVRDLTPLRGRPLVGVDLGFCPNLHDLTPLAGMKLTHLSMPPDVTKGIDGIRNMKTLIAIDSMPVQAFWQLWDKKKSTSK